jgi:hypothetical protein
METLKNLLMVLAMATLAGLLALVTMVTALWIALVIIERYL